MQNAISGIVGRLGTGKTLALTYFVKRTLVKNPNTKIYSNYHLNGVDYEYVNTLEQIENMNNGTAFMDELWSWLDSRASPTKKNRVISSILLKSRKRTLNLFYTAQVFRQVDIRLRRITDYLIKPQLAIYIPLQGYDEKIPIKCTLNVYEVMGELIDPVPMKTFKFYTIPIFDMYDTKEEIEILG